MQYSAVRHINSVRPDCITTCTEAPPALRASTVVAAALAHETPGAPQQWLEERGGRQSRATRTEPGARGTFPVL